MKTEVRLHQESCFHVALEVLLMKLLAYRIYLPIEERINFMALKRLTAEGWECIASEKMSLPLQIGALLDQVPSLHVEEAAPVSSDTHNNIQI